jgi:hypothetical protein
VSGSYRRPINSSIPGAGNPWVHLPSVVLERSQEADAEDEDGGQVVAYASTDDYGLPCTRHRIIYPLHLRMRDSLSESMRRHLIRYIDSLNRINTEAMEHRRKSLSYKASTVSC